jgi:hypothetical protein
MLESPRKRRRLAWIGALVVAGAVAAGVALVIPSPKPENPNPTGNEGPAQVVTNTSVRLTGADRRAIDALLAKFVPAAVGRKSATEAWALAGPELKASTTLSDWKAGNSPVPAYPVKERTFTGWPTVDVERNQVTLSLLVHPATRRQILGDYTFSVQAIRLHHRWLVNRIYTVAINHPVRGSQREIGPADFNAPSAGRGQPTGKPRLASTWLLPVVAILSVALLAPLAIGVAVFIRSRRRRRRLIAEGRTELPPLPSTFRSR